MDDKLTGKQQKFVGAMAIEDNATKAALAAGYSPPSASSIGSENLQKPAVALAVAAERAAACVRNNVTQDRILEGLARIAFADIRDIFDSNGALLPMDQWTDDISHAISSLETIELTSEGVKYGELSKIKQADRLTALKLLGQYMELFTENVKHTGIVTHIHLRPGDVQAAGKVIDNEY